MLKWQIIHKFKLYILSCLTLFQILCLVRHASPAITLLLGHVCLWLLQT